MAPRIFPASRALSATLGYVFLTGPPVAGLSMRRKAGLETAVAQISR